jgi:hypothetical protein
MPTHYVYDEPKKTELNQGDILRRSDGLVALLDEYFPYYAKHRDYVYFMVLTQTCDLVRRDGDPCVAPYISMAAVRPIKDVVLMEAAKHQHVRLQATNIVGNKARDRLAMFLESLMDNNKAGLFYLHTDTSLDITEPYCAFLQLSISFRAQHYDKCLDAKIAQLKEPFQAKLGWLIGNMYSRVATTEWNIENRAEKVGKVASKLLQQTIDNFDDEQIKVALAELQDDGRIETMTVKQIAKHVREKELVPKLKQFKDRATETLGGLKVVDPVKSAILDALRQDDALKQAIVALLPAQEGIDRQAAADEALRLVFGKIRDAVSDEPSADRDKYIVGLVTDLMADNVLKSLIR